MNQCNQKKTNLFIVGFSKCGTTALAEMLNRHSDISYGLRKELYYFDTKYYKSKGMYPFPKDDKVINNHKILNRDIPVFENESDYLKSFNEVSDSKYLLDATVFYILYEEIAKEIYKFNPNSKIIIVIRNPIMRAWSNYIYLNMHKEMNISDVILLEKKFINEGYHPFNLVMNQGFYVKRILNYIKIFGTKNVKLILDEDLKKSPGDTIKDIENWLGVNEEKIATNLYRNKSGTENLYLSILKKLGNIKIFNKKLKLFVPNKTKEKIIFNNTNSIKIDKYSYEILYNIYLEEIQEIEKLLNKDLSNWHISDDFNNE